LRPKSAGLILVDELVQNSLYALCSLVCYD
jgi:hypothetical protein